jgi:hypothetical protein
MYLLAVLHARFMIVLFCKFHQAILLFKHPMKKRNNDYIQQHTDVCFFILNLKPAVSEN